MNAPRRGCATSKVAIGANICRRRPASTPTPIRNISQRHGNSARSQTGSSRSIPGCGALPYPLTTRSGCAGEASSKLQRLGKCDVLLVADAKELASRVGDLPADAGIDPASEQQINQQLGRLAEALTRRDEILAVLR